MRIDLQNRSESIIRKVMEENYENRSEDTSKQNKLGPLGLGDPYSTELRRVESEVLIPKLTRQRAKELKCVDDYKEFEKCCKKHYLLNFMKCKQEAKNMFACFEKWCNDEQFKAESTKIYLEQRKRFRMTGESQKLKRLG